MDFKNLQLLSDLCKEVMRSDQYRLEKRVRAFKEKLKARQPLDDQEYQQLATDIEKSLKRRQYRAANLPIPQFPDELPVSERRADIAAAMATNQVIIVAGETGSGKTTQLPKICLTL